jgi:hypothetical protein
VKLNVTKRVCVTKLLINPIIRTRTRNFVTRTLLHVTISFLYPPFCFFFLFLNSFLRQCSFRSHSYFLVISLVSSFSLPLFLFSFLINFYSFISCLVLINSFLIAFSSLYFPASLSPSNQVFFIFFYIIFSSSISLFLLLFFLPFSPLCSVTFSVCFCLSLFLSFNKSPLPDP